MGKNKALAHHTSTLPRIDDVSIAVLYLERVRAYALKLRVSMRVRVCALAWELNFLYWIQDDLACQAGDYGGGG